MFKKLLVAISFCALGMSAAQAQIKVGVILSMTGPAAALGIPEKQTIDLLPRTFAGKTVEFIALDDATDPTSAVTNARKLITQEHVDVIVGPSLTPNSIALIDAVTEGETPVISLASSATIVEPMDAKRAWIFKVPQGDALQADGNVRHMVKSGVKSFAYIGFADSYGNAYGQEMARAAAANNVAVVANERYNRNDTSVVAQALKIIAAKPDAVFIGAAGSPAVLPQATLRERGYQGKIYQTNGVTSNEFLRVGGKAVEGTLLLVTPMLVAEQLPASNPSKKPALEFLAAYEGKFGKDSRSNFAALSWDAWKILEHALPAALGKASPGTREFRKALRDQIENTKNLPLNTGVFNYSPSDHSGLVAGDMVWVTIQNNHWKPVQ